MPREIRFSLLVKQNFDKAVQRGARALRRLGSISRSVAGGIRKAFSNAFNIKGLIAGAAPIAALGTSIKAAFNFETIETQFKVLLGSTEAAKKRLKELTEFSANTPFQLDEIAAASRQLHVFSEGVLGGTDSLESIGDAAAAVNQSIQDVSFWVGRAYSAIQGGQPFGEAAMRLQEMGIMTPKVRKEMEDLQEAGGSADDVFGLLTTRLGEFDGGMEDLSKTGNGLISTLKDNWTLALAEFGKEFMDLSKNAIGGLIDRIKELRESGQLQEWAKSAAQSVKIVGGLLGNLFGDTEQRMAALRDLGAIVKSIFQDAGSVFVNTIRPPLYDLFREVAGRFFDLIPDWMDKGRDPRGDNFKTVLEDGTVLHEGKYPQELRTNRTKELFERLKREKSLEESADTVKKAEDDRKKADRLELSKSGVDKAEQAKALKEMVVAAMDEGQNPNLLNTENVIERRRAAQRASMMAREADLSKQLDMKMTSVLDSRSRLFLSPNSTDMSNQPPGADRGSKTNPLWVSVGNLDTK